MNEIPGGPNGLPQPAGDFAQGKPRPVGTPPEANWRLYAKVLIWVVVAVITILFLVLNTDSVTIHFVFFTVSVPTFIALLVALILGMLLGGTGAWWSARRKRKAAPLADDRG